MEKTTIVNVTTPLLKSATSIIRISGPLSFKIIDKIFYPINKNNYKKKSHKVYYGHIKINNEIIDEVIILLMKKPNSFTGENVIEIQMHGNPYIVERTLKKLVQIGCTLSEPGEFTKRAFLNGKMDLLQCESILDLINANNKKSLNIAIKQLKGNLTNEINHILKATLRIISFLEASVDFPEDEIDNLFDYKSIEKETRFFIKKIQKLLSTYKEGKIYREGVTIALIGAPNVGKSSIFNLLLKEKRSIVTNIAGTTRDMIEEKFILNNININLIDTAGIHHTKDIVEKKGIDKTFFAYKKAQIIIFIKDNNKKILKEEKNFIKKLKKDKKNYILIENKIDLQKNKENKKIKNSILFSVKNKIGLDKLEKKIKKILNIKNTENEILITNVRCYELLKKSLVFLNNSLEEIKKKTPYDLISIDFKNVYEILGQITGKTINEKLLDEIFSNFCIGK